MYANFGQPLNDLCTKVQKALAVDGPSFINAHSLSSGLGLQRKTPSNSPEAVNTCFWPLYEVENGVYKLTYKPKEKKPVIDWLKKQGRFRHLFKAGNEEILAEIQKYVDEEWEKLLQKCQ